MTTKTKTGSEKETVPRRRCEIPKWLEPFLPPLCSLLISGLYMIIGAAVISSIETSPSFRISQLNQSLPLKLREHLEEERQHDLDVAWQLRNSIMFCFTTLTTIGFGNLTPKTVMGRIFTCVYALLGIPLFGISLANFGKFFTEYAWRVIFGLKRFGKKLYARLIINPKEKWQKLKSDGNRKISVLRTESEQEPDYCYGPLPFLLILVFFVLWLSLGMVLFPQIQHLSYFDSLYFSFISLTTIGYGDIFPQDHSYYFLVMVYLCVGLTLNYIAIEVMAEWLRKFHYMGRDGDLEAPSQTPVWLGPEKLKLKDIARVVAHSCDVSGEKLKAVMKNCDNMLNEELRRIRRSRKSGLEVQFYYRDSVRGPRRTATAVRLNAADLHPASAECYQISLESE